MMSEWQTEFRNYEIDCQPDFLSQLYTFQICYQMNILENLDALLQEEAA